MTRKKPCQGFAYEIGGGINMILYPPLAVLALKRFQTRVCSPMDSKCSGNCESLFAAREFAPIRPYIHRIT